MFICVVFSKNTNISFPYVGNCPIILLLHMRELWDEREGFRLVEKEKARFQRESECEERARKIETELVLRARGECSCLYLSSETYHLQN